MISRNAFVDGDLVMVDFGDGPEVATYSGEEWLGRLAPDGRVWVEFAGDVVAVFPSEIEGYPEDDPMRLYVGQKTAEVDDAKVDAIWERMTDNEKYGLPMGLFPSWVGEYDLTTEEHVALMGKTGSRKQANYLVVDNEFNQANHPDLVGKVFDYAVPYTSVEETDAPATHQLFPGRIQDAGGPGPIPITSRKEPMRTEAEILSAMSRASLDEQRRLSHELDALRAHKRAKAQADRDTDIANAVIRDTLTPVIAHERTTTATDWLGDVVSSGEYDHAMRTEATLWFRKISSEVKEDRDEFAEQAMGMARRHSGKYGETAEAAYRAFLDTVARLYKQSDDSPGQVDEDQSGNAESQVTDYDTKEDQDPMWAEDWDGEDDTGSEIGAGHHPEPSGASGSDLDADTAFKDSLGRLRKRAEGDTCPSRSDGGDHLYGAHDGKCRLCGADFNRESSLRKRAEGQTCSTCGDSIEQDPEGEEPRTWHHNNGESHDHEASPSESKESRRRRAELNTGSPEDFQRWHEQAEKSIGKRVRSHEGLRGVVESVAEVNQYSGMPYYMIRWEDGTSSKHISWGFISEAYPDQWGAEGSKKPRRLIEAGQGRRFVPKGNGAKAPKSGARKTALTYGELPDSIGTGMAAPNMACPNGDCEEYAIPYSANRGDYFWANPSDTVSCGECGAPMQLVSIRSGVDFLGARKKTASDTLDPIWQELNELSEKAKSRPDLIAGAERAYDLGWDEGMSWFHAQSLDDLKFLWEVNPMGMNFSWDDEVYEALFAKGHFSSKRANRKTALQYAVRDEYDDKGTLTLWSGGFASDYEGEAVPSGNGYHITLYSGMELDVVTPHRDDKNFDEVDQKINEAIWMERGKHLGRKTAADEELCESCGVNPATMTFSESDEEVYEVCPSCHEGMLNDPNFSERFASRKTAGANVLNIKKRKGVAGEFAFEVDVQYDDEEPMRVNFYGSDFNSGSSGTIIEFGGRQETQTYVSDPQRFGYELNEEWVRNFFATASKKGSR